MEMIRLALSAIAKSSTNPRKIFTHMDELTASVREKGVLSPVLARPHPKPTKGVTHELVAGERRLRAANDAGLSDIPVVVRELSDLEALDIQVIENGQRADVHPLEEAEAYEQMQVKHGRTVDEIADKVGKSKAYVYARMKLLALGPDGRKAFYDGKLTASTALYVARIPVSLQGQALKEIIDEGRGEPMTARQAQDHIQRRYMLRLADAPFSTDDAGLCQKAGACVDCQKRTGNQRELFADVEHDDVCTDPSCYDEKVDAAWKIKAAGAAAQGVEVISATEAKKLFPYAHSSVYSDKYVDLDEETWVGSKRKTNRSLLFLGGKAAKPVAIVRNPHTGAIVELARKSDSEKAARAAQPKSSSSSPAKKKKETDEEKKDREKAKRDLEVKKRAGALAIEEMVGKAEKRKSDMVLFRRVAFCMLEQVVDGSEALERRKVGESLGAIEKYLDGLTEAQLRGLLFECTLPAPAVALHMGDYYPEFKKACQENGVDLKALEKVARAAIAAEEKAPAKREATAAAKPKKKTAHA